MLRELPAPAAAPRETFGDAAKFGDGKAGIPKSISEAHAGTVLRHVQQGSRTSAFRFRTGKSACSMQGMGSLLGLLLALAGMAWANRRRRRRLVLREAMRQLRAARLLARRGHFIAAEQYANDVLERALRERDAVREALAHEALGDVARRAGDVRVAVHHWRLSAMALQVIGSTGDVARVARKVAAALQQARAAGARCWQRRAALLELRVMDEDWQCAKATLRFGTETS